VNHDRTLKWVEDLSVEMKEIRNSVTSVGVEVSKLRESLVRHMGMWTGGAIVVSTILTIIGSTIISKLLK